MCRTHGLEKTSKRHLQPIEKSFFVYYEQENFDCLTGKVRIFLFVKHRYFY